MSILSSLRGYNTDQHGRYYSELQKTAVWQKAAPVPGKDASVWRMDSCGALIKWLDFGNVTEAGNGWEIDHIVPVAHGGSDVLGNLQALQWQNNRHKGDSLYQNYCLISYQGA